MPRSLDTCERLARACQNVRKLPGVSVKIAAEVFGVSKRTVYRWCAAEGAQRPHGPHKKTGRKSKCTEEVEEEICQWMMQDAARRQVDAVAMVEESYGLKISQQTVSNILKKHDVTRKKLSHVYSEQKGREQEVEAFQAQMAALPKESWAAMDESGFNLKAGPRYGYAKRGEPAYAETNGKGSHHNYSLMLALRWTKKTAGDSRGRGGQNTERQEGREGTAPSVLERLQSAGLLLQEEPRAVVRDLSPIVAWKLVKRTVNAVVFQNYVERGLGSRQRTQADERLNLALDNARIHHATKACIKNNIPTIAETADAAGVSLKYLPPYFPQLNPVELAFKVIKNDFVRRLRPRTEVALVAAIEKGLRALTRKKVNAMFEHCFTRYNPIVVQKALTRKAL